MPSRARILVAGVVGLVGAAAALGGIGLAALLAGTYQPAPVQPAAVRCPAEAPPLPRGKRLRILVWNLQFAGSRRYRFFYDGGRAVSVPAPEVRATLDGLAAVVRQLDPDLVLWQEVDRGSRRTGHIDELAELLDRLDYPCAADAPYHKAAYVPHPPHEPLGRVDMRLVIASRYRIEAATRVDLPRLDEPWIRQQFNLKRALLTADLPLEGGGRLRLFNTHLSAFSRRDGTLPRQLEAVARQLDAATAEGTPWVLGADLNSLPPGDDPARLGEQGALYEPVSPLTDWFERYTPAFPLSEHHADPAPYRTYLPFGSEVADRAIDHLFYGPGVQMHGASVVREAHQHSDHLPLIFDFAIP